MADRLIGNRDGADVSVDTNFDDDGGGRDTDDDDGGGGCDTDDDDGGGVSDHTNGDQARWRREPVHLLFHQQGRQP